MIHTEEDLSNALQEMADTKKIKPNKLRAALIDTYSPLLTTKPKKLARHQKDRSARFSCPHLVFLLLRSVFSLFRSAQIVTFAGGMEGPS